MARAQERVRQRDRDADAGGPCGYTRSRPGPSAPSSLRVGEIVHRLRPDSPPLRVCRVRNQLLLPQIHDQIQRFERNHAHQTFIP
jgi:hypothetical protein